LRLPSGAGTQHRSVAMPQTRSLLATLDIFLRNFHYSSRRLSAEIGTVLAIHGL
jgi:hypothetical protein